MQIGEIRSRFVAESTLEGRIDQAFSAVRSFGFDAMIYDYTPVPLDPDGTLIAPSVLKLRNISEDMHEYWFDRGYFQIDPVQLLALRTTAPFFWNYDTRVDTLINTLLDEKSAPVSRYLHERDMSCGVTVPVHMPHGDFATVTAVWFGDSPAHQRDAEHHMADFGLLAHVFHEAAFSLMGKTERKNRQVHLTERERECLRHAAEGLSAKETSRIIGRSVPTVVMHLNSAARKLGARNRIQAVVRATHYRLLEEH
jgi:LuxR family transcriptional regulator